VVNTSSIYETDPVGYENQEQFLNMAIQVSTALNPFELLDTCLEIELNLGRKRDIRWGPRTIDLDILLFNHENIETEKLIVPHPRMHERAFVLIPLLEIDSSIRLPKMERPLSSILEDIPDREGVRIWKRKNGEDVFALFES
jgi:2-amino-4-hydroxy-6-hydroxymethyldihydropteridine diphosphokinase